MKAQVVSVNISDKKGQRKKGTDEVLLKGDFGIEGDAHASGEWHRQVSLASPGEYRKDAG